MFSDEVFGALIGAGAAVSAQIVAIIAQIFTQRRQFKLREREIELQAARAFDESRLLAVKEIRERLLSFRDGDLDAMQTYRSIRHNLIFLDERTETDISLAILANVSNSTYERPEREAKRLVDNVLLDLKSSISPN